jgi:hypothetical protein
MAEQLGRDRRLTGSNGLPPAGPLSAPTISEAQAAEDEKRAAKSARRADRSCARDQ